RRLPSSTHFPYTTLFRSADSFSKLDMKYAQNHLRILSGLYGMLRPLDLMQPYRLEMGTAWAITPKTTSLYKYWKTVLTDEIKEGDRKSTRLNSSHVKISY